MRAGTLLIAGLVAMLAAGALAILFVGRSASPPSDPALGGGGGPQISTTPQGARSAGGLAAPASLEPLGLVSPPGPSRLEELLVEFDRVWAAPGSLQGRARADALQVRAAEVEHLAWEVAKLGGGAIEEIRSHLTRFGTSYPRKTLLVTALSLEGSEAALTLLADVAVEQKEWRLRWFSFQKLAGSNSRQAMEIALETLPRLEDPRFLIPVLTAEWDPGKVEVAYRLWLGVADVKPRTQSYSYLPKMKGEWIPGLLMEVASSEEGEVPERAGAIASLGLFRVEGILEFLADLLWREENLILIKAIVSSIRRIGGDEARQILEGYLAGGVPEELEALVQKAAQGQPLAKPMSAGSGQPGEASLGAVRVDPDRFGTEGNR